MQDDKTHTHQTQSQTSETRRWNYTLITADHNIVNLDDDSRNHHQSALIVQNGQSDWLQGCPATTQDAQGNSIVFEKISAYIKKRFWIFTENSKEFINASQDL